MRLDDDVRDVLQAATVVGDRLTLAPGQLDRKLYVRVAKVIELMGGAWLRREKCHVFRDPAEDVVADAIATGAVVDFRKAFQFFETPEPIAARLVETADITPGMVVLEPSAGGGRIVRAVRAVGVEPVACELWDKNREKLTAQNVSLVGADFLQLDYPCDRIVANPPFARGQDVDHVTRMWEQLRPGGRLVSVMAPSWPHRQQKKHAAFRALVESVAGEWELLPEGSFSESGTEVRAGVLVLDKAA